MKDTVMEFGELKILGSKWLPTSPEKNDRMADTEDKDKKSSGRKNRLSVAASKEPTFFIGGNNGVAVVAKVMEDLGWKRIMEKTDERYKLKWCELKSGINYAAFKEGEQLVNIIPNSTGMTNKLGLLNSLQEYDKLQTAMRRGKTPRVKLDFVPETYRLDDPRDREIFFDIHKPGDIWICKPTARNQGKGIFLVRDIEEVRKLTEVEECNRGRPSRPLNRIIQRYITNPLLLENKKFDIRCYMLVASTVPYLVLYHSGYVRTAIHDYDNDCDNLVAHLTNQYIQKKDPTYKDVKEDTAWTMERFSNYMDQHVLPNMGLEPGWVDTVLEERIQQIMKYTFNAAKHRLSTKVGYFAVYGFDFMVDSNLKVTLLEVNVNPCLATNCEALREVVPEVIKETLHISIECFEKSRRGKPLLPLQASHNFKILYTDTSPRVGPRGGKLRRTCSISPLRHSKENLATPVAAIHTSVTARTQKRAASDSPTRRGCSLSPVKEAKEVKEIENAPKVETMNKTKKGVFKGVTPKATTITNVKANLSSKSATTAKMLPPQVSSPYAVKLRIGPPDNVKLKMSHNAAEAQRSKSTTKAETDADEEKDVLNRGS